MKMTSFRCYDFLGRGRGRPLCRTWTSIFLSVVSIWSLTLPMQADGNYNLYMDRHEVHRLLGLSSDIYLVREGVVNEYALNFVVNVPSQIEKLHFSWQSLIKKPVHYELAIEFADFIALQSPSSNISTHGRVPQKLETFRIILPCSGRLSTEVSVIIRFTFFYKSPKHNATLINIRRNKICLTKEFSGLDNRQSSLEPGAGSVAVSKGNGVVAGDGIISGGVGSVGPVGLNTNILNERGNSTLFIFQDPTPSLLLAGLLGGCAVTASIVFLTFFICLRRKLVPSSSTDSSCTSSGQNLDPNNMSTNSSPACLLRQNVDSKWITLPGSHSGSSSTKDNFCSSNLIGGGDPIQIQAAQAQLQQQHAHILRSNSPMTRSWSRNSYVTIASFWNDVFSTGIPGGQQQPLQHQHHLSQQSTNNCYNSSRAGSKMSGSTFGIPGNRISTNSNNTSSTTTKGSDVSPYAYAHILGIPPPPSSQPTHQSLSPLPKQTGLMDWYSQVPSPAPPSCTNIPNGGHIYSNHLYTFNPSPKHTSIMSLMSSTPPPSQPPPPPAPPSNASPRMTIPIPAEVTTPPTTASQPQIQQQESNSPEVTMTMTMDSSTAGRSGSESLIQIDGWQCRKNFTKETDVIERFL